MKDLNGLTHSFPEWNAVLDFLSGVIPTRDNVGDIHIAKKGDNGWITRINGTKTNGNRKPEPTSGVGLHDLNW